MYKDHYQLSAEPFRLTPDPGFVYSHPSYRTAHANMVYALEQGDGILVVTGRSGTGKTTLVENFLARLKPHKVLTATLVSTHLEAEDLLRMVAYAFGLDAKNLDKATLLRELENLLTRQPRALLIIDEAQNLSFAALEEVRMLTNMHIRSRPLMQIFLLGQEQLRERLHTPEIEQLHQRVVAACVLKPLTLQETQDYVLHRLSCASWRGNPLIATEAFVLIHRFSQGLPRYISKLCTRLFLHGALEHVSRLDIDDVATVIREIQDELLLPLPSLTQPMECSSLPDMQEFARTKTLPIEQRLSLSKQEKAFLARNPAEFKPVVASIDPATASAARPATVSAASPATASAGEAAVCSPARTSANHNSMLRTRKRSAKDVQGHSRQGAPLAHWSLKRPKALYRRATRAIHAHSRLEWLKDIYRRATKAINAYRRPNWLNSIVTPTGEGKLVGVSALALLALAGVFSLDLHDSQQQRAVIRDQTIASAPQKHIDNSLPANVTGPGKASQLTAIDGAMRKKSASSTEISHGEPQKNNKPSQPQLPQAEQEPLEQIADLITVATQDLVAEPSDSLDYIVITRAPLKPRQPTTEAMASNTPVLPATPAAAPIIASNEAEDLSEAFEIMIMEVSASEFQAKPAASDETDELAAQVVQKTRLEKIEELLLLGEQAIARDRLRFPEEKSAWRYYKQVLELDPGNAGAAQGLQQIAARYGQLTVSAMEKQQYESALRFIDRGLGVVRKDSELLSLQGEIQAAQAELLAQQEREQLLEQQAWEAASRVATADTQSESRGLFGALKRIFGGDGT